MSWKGFNKYFKAYTQIELIEIELDDIEIRSLEYWNHPGEEGITPPANCDKNFKRYRLRQISRSAR